jgi:hypothetical protein
MIFEKLYIPENAFYSRVADLVAGFNDFAANSALSLREKTTELKCIFDRFVELAVNEAKLSVNPGLFNDCVLRIEYLADIIGDQPYSLSPEIIANGTLVRQEGISSLWAPLISEREDAAEKIKSLHDGLIESEQERRAHPLMKTEAGLTFRLPPVGEGGMLADNSVERIARKAQRNCIRGSEGTGQVVDFITRRTARQRRNMP